MDKAYCGVRAPAGATHAPEDRERHRERNTANDALPRGVPTAG